jgi:FkbM family methyltransferase
MAMVKGLVKHLAHLLGFELRRRRAADLPFVQRIHCDGDQFEFWIADEHAKRWWHKPQLDLNAELRCLRAMCHPGSVVFDVGAHHGMITVQCARWAGSAGHVYAFEANPSNALILAANIALNDLKNCTPVHAVIGRDVGVSAMAGETVAPARTGAKGRSVDRISLDEFCHRGGVKQVDVLKIDVEGFEAEVLRGSRQLLESKPRMDIEIHIDELPRFGASAVSMLDLIDMHSYQALVMIRPDWDNLAIFRDTSELPASGVINLFLWPGSSIPREVFVSERRPCWR